MNSLRLTAITSVLALLLSAYALWRQVALEKKIASLRVEFDNNICTRSCERELRQQLDHFRMDSIALVVSHEGNSDAFESLENEKRSALDRYKACLQECDNQLQRAYDQEQPAASKVPALKTELDITCTGGPGAAILLPVHDICTAIEGACENCLDSFCAGSLWQFETDTPVEISLVACPPTAENVRLISDASFRAGRFLLNVPNQIQLPAGEQLSLRFQQEFSGFKKRVHVRVYH